MLARMAQLSAMVVFLLPGSNCFRAARLNSIRIIVIRASRRSAGVRFQQIENILRLDFVLDLWEWKGGCIFHFVIVKKHYVYAILEMRRLNKPVVCSTKVARWNRSRTTNSPTRPSSRRAAALADYWKPEIVWSTPAPGYARKCVETVEYFLFADDVQIAVID